MPISRVTPKRLPVSPGRDSRFTIKHNPFQGNQWWVYYEHPGIDPVPADGPHEELVNCVYRLKEIEGNQPGGAFSINEHGQVIARMTAPAGYGQNALHVVDVSAGAVFCYTQVITFGGGVFNPVATPSEGTSWAGPLCGTTYTFSAPNAPRPPSNRPDEVRIEVNGTPIQLSTQCGLAPYPPSIGALANFLAALRRQIPNGGRFRVNEHGRAFRSDNNLFIGVVPLQHWFKPISIND